MEFRVAQKKAGAEYRAGKLGAVRKKAVAAKPKAKKVGAVRKAAPKRKTVIRTERLTTIGKARSTGRKSAGNATLSRALAIQRKIDALHKKVTAAKSKDMKEVYKLACNAEYDKLNALKRQLSAR